MRRLRNWFLSWFRTASVARRLWDSDDRLAKLEAQRAASMETLNRREAALDELAKRVQVDIDNAQRIHKRYESALEEVREQNHVLETTVKTLVASHRVLMERYDAEAAIAARARVAASSISRE